MKKGLLLEIIGIALIAIFVFVGALQAQTYSWKMATQENEGDMMTVFAKKFADEMKQWSGGKVNINVYPYGTLGSMTDINEQLQTGTIQLLYGEYGWAAGFVPEIELFSLAYLWPRDKTFEVYAEVMRHGNAVKLLESKYRQKNFQCLGYATEGFLCWTSSKPLKTIKDMKGFKMRTFGSKIMIETFKKYGASPTTMDLAEVYSALQMKLMDGQLNPLWFGYTQKFHEVCKYFTTAYDYYFVGMPFMNRKVYDSLPKEMQEKMKQIWDKYLEESARWCAQKDEKYKNIMLKERPDMVFSNFSNEQIKPFAERAKTIYPLYYKIAGHDSQKILDAFLDDIEKAKEKFGVK